MKVIIKWSRRKQFRNRTLIRSTNVEMKRKRKKIRRKRKVRKRSSKVVGIGVVGL